MKAGNIRHQTKTTGRKGKGEMAKRQNIDREGLEVYLLNLLLAYGPILKICGLLFLIYAVVALQYSIIMGSITFGLAIVLILLSSSYQAALWVAKIGAWLGTLRKDNG